MSTTITVELPDDIASVSREKWGDNLSQLTLESLAAHGYRIRTLSGAHVQRMLGLEARMEVDAFIKQHGIHLNDTETELEKDMATLKRLREQ
jgi:hypothetical protein